MVQVEVSKELAEKIYKLVESVKVDGKLRKGANETTKSIERGDALLVVAAGDVNPPEITMHMPLLSKEKSIPFVSIPSKAELGAAAGLPVGTASVAILNAGEARKQLQSIIKDLETLGKSAEKPIKEVPVEKPVETQKVAEKASESKEELPEANPKVEESKQSEKPAENPIEKKDPKPKNEENKANEKPEEAPKTKEKPK